MRRVTRRPGFIPSVISEDFITRDSRAILDVRMYGSKNWETEASLIFHAIPISDHR